jgi:hypothetical protein
MACPKIWHRRQKLVPFLLCHDNLTLQFNLIKYLKLNICQTSLRLNAKVTKELFEENILIIIYFKTFHLVCDQKLISLIIDPGTSFCLLW